MNVRSDRPIPAVDPAPTQQEGALSAYLAAIRVHPLIVVLITLATVGASIAFLVTRSPQYEGTADLLVEPRPQDDEAFVGLPVFRDSGDPVRTIQTAVSLIESRQAAELTAQRLGDGWTGEKVLDAVEVAPQGESNIVAVSAKAGSAQQAARVANEFTDAVFAVRDEALSEAIDDQISELQARLDAVPPGDPVTRSSLIAQLSQLRSALGGGDPTLSLSQAAVPPDAPTGASPPLVVALALLAGIVLGSGTALLIELLTRRIRDEEEAMRIYPVPVLARVPLVPARARRGPPGSTWYMPAEIREPFRTLTVQLEQSGRRAGAVMITSPTKGDGKTNSAINLAVSLAATGQRVVVLDFDLRHPQISAGLGMTDGHRLSDLTDPGTSLNELLVRPSELRSLSVLPLMFDPDDATLTDSVAWRLPELIEQARSLADYVIVDTPPLGEVSDALMLARVVDEILVVMRPGNTRRSHLAVVRELLDRIGHTPEGSIIIGAAEVGGRGYRAYGYGPGGAPELILKEGRTVERQSARALGVE